MPHIAASNDLLISHTNDVRFFNGLSCGHVIFIIRFYSAIGSDERILNRYVRAERELP